MDIDLGSCFSEHITVLLNGQIVERCGWLEATEGIDGHVLMDKDAGLPYRRLHGHVEFVFNLEAIGRSEEEARRIIAKYG